MVLGQKRQKKHLHITSIGLRCWWFPFWSFFLSLYRKEKKGQSRKLWLCLLTLDMWLMKVDPRIHWSGRPPIKLHSLHFHSGQRGISYPVCFVWPSDMFPHATSHVHLHFHSSRTRYLSVHHVVWSWRLWVLYGLRWRKIKVVNFIKIESWLIERLQLSSFF